MPVVDYCINLGARNLEYSGYGIYLTIATIIGFWTVIGILNLKPIKNLAIKSLQSVEKIAGGLFVFIGLKNLLEK